MVRQKLLSALVVGTLLAFCLPGISSATACTLSESLTENCPEGIISGGFSDGRGVDLFAERSSNSPGGTGGSAGRGGGGSGVSVADICASPTRSLTLEEEWNLCGTGQFLLLSRHAEWPPTIAAPMTSCTACAAETIVRVSDLQNFPAAAVPVGMEPNGWAIVGLAANFWAGTSTQIGEGLLLGQSAQVLFTPIGYRWSYGDGTATSSASGGSSWETLGLAEFSATDSSHVYTEKGTFSVILTIDYHADYSFGDQGWRPVEGIVTVPSAPFTVIAARESTVLVAEDCLTNPRGPGC